tara:strand:- start:108 stop:1274 length:1167 start_codon:yes stop_codon:yes gene_type:complete
MNVAFYYHISLSVSKSEIYAPSYLGVFLDSLAKNVDNLYLVFHSQNLELYTNCDYKLKAKNITHVNLGKKTPAWHRLFYHKKILRKIKAQIYNCDAFIVRSPTPLAPFFYKFFDIKKIYFLIVGDYLKGANHLKSSNFRNKIIYLFLKFYDNLFNIQIKKTKIIVNSHELLEKYKHLNNKINLIKTTTLSVNDFFLKEVNIDLNNIRLVYTGRIEPAKGLLELVYALKELNSKYSNVCLHIAGWEQDSVRKPFQNKIIKLCKKLEIQNKIVFHGKKSVGEELNNIYRLGDIYVLPSYHEGFPRTIWEAMANSLPVIATNVGGIPNYLEDNKNVILIKPRSVDEIVSAIEKLLNNRKLIKTLTKNGYTLASKNTLDIQSKNMINIIKKQ